MQRRAPTSITFSQRITRSITTEAARLLAAAALLCCVTGATAPNLSAGDLVALYDRAMTDPGAPPVDRFEIEGTIAGAGLTGTFHSWQDGDNERTDQSLGLRQERTIRLGARYFFVSSTGNVGGLHLAKLDDLEIAGAAMRDLVVTTLDLGASTLGAFRIDGILGFPFFASADVRIDFAHDTMDFGTPGSLAPTGERLDADLDRGLIEIPATANDVAAPFMLDTGDAAGLLLYGPFVRKHTSLAPTTLDSARSFGLGGEADSYRTSLDRLLLGSTALYNVDTDVMLATQGAFADRFDAGNIGLGLLKNFVVTFDAQNGAVYLDRSSAFDDGHVPS
jgi:hypothetical protein